MTFLDRTKFIKDGIFVLGSLIAESITDPQASNRASTEKFVITSWPDKPVRYPLISIEQVGFESNYTGMQSTNSITNIDYEINVWSKDVSGRDSLAGSIFNVLESNRSKLAASGLMTERFYNMTNLDETGPQGVHRKLIGVRFLWPSS